MTRAAVYECKRCRLQLPAHEFGMTGCARWARRRSECEVCRHQRLAREHAREAEKLLEARRRRREREWESARMARAASGQE